MTLRSRQEYEVEVTVTSIHRYNVVARTPEEAESDAEQMYEDGDRGDTLSAIVDLSIALPVDDEPLEEEELLEPSFD